MPNVPEFVITAYPDGLLLVRGAHRIVDVDVHPVSPADPGRGGRSQRH